MPNITQIKLILKQPLPIILRKIRTLAIEKATHKYWALKYTSVDFRKNVSSKSSLFNFELTNLNLVNCTNINKNVQDYLIEMYINHRFDLLGSGWVKNSYHSTANGIEEILFENDLKNLQLDENGNWLAEIVNAKHLNFSKYLWEKIRSENKEYQPIDWQKDFKSGFRFNAKTDYLNQNKLVKHNGIDLKIPWELGRLQHLPQLAIFYKNNLNQVEIIKEFKCQILDFIMANPIGMGVNWTCTMDVGIRAANICIAYDWFKQLDNNKIIDVEFDEIITQYIYSHGSHIFNNFEYKEGLTSNHYLGNIAGLTFVSCYLKNVKEANFWLAYSIQELNSELKRQFFNDGSNFEGSTSYHRLSGEMMVYCFAILHKISDKRLESLSELNSKSFYTIANYTKTDFTNKAFLSPTSIHTFYNMAAFTLAYTKPNGNITQVGDNDSGRFLKLSPCGEFINTSDVFNKYSHLTRTNDYAEQQYWDENHINHASFVAAINGFFNSSILHDFSKEFTLEFNFIHSLVNTTYNSFPFSLNSVVEQKMEELNFRKSTTIATHSISEEQLTLNFFPDFGFVSISSNDFYLSISFGANKLSHHSWGHYHNDKLAVELQVDNKDILFDPGTYIYTPIPSQRNYFRSTMQHNTISVNDIEQNYFNPSRSGLFSLRQDIKTNVLKTSKTHVIVMAEYHEIKHIRELKIVGQQIEIIDYCNKPFEQSFESKPYSNGYGKLLSISKKTTHFKLNRVLPSFFF